MHESSSYQMQSEIPLWPNGAPGALGIRPEDIPSITPFIPDPGKETGAAVIVCPGGGYVFLADHEGAGYAQWLRNHGITAFVLKYRLGNQGYHHPTMLHDAARAVRTVRNQAAKWNIDPTRIGIMGSSAGGHLASTLLTRFDGGTADSSDPVERESSRPDVGILCYPVITFQAPHLHEGSKNNLLGLNASQELVDMLSNEKWVTPETPPCFIFHTVEDTCVRVENVLLFATALRKQTVPFDLHIYQDGCHGMGLGRDVFNEPEKHPWTKDCIYWLKSQKFLK